MPALEVTNVLDGKLYELPPVLPPELPPLTVMLPLKLSLCVSDDATRIPPNDLPLTMPLKGT